MLVSYSFILRLQFRGNLQQKEELKDSNEHLGFSGTKNQIFPSELPSYYFCERYFKEISAGKNYATNHRCESETQWQFI